MNEKGKEKYAVITSGGKQFSVTEGDRVSVEKLAGQPGEDVVFDQVLAVRPDGGDLKIGTPIVDGASVTGKILGTTAGDKVIAFKKIRRKGKKVRRGHRQISTHVQIESIQA